MNYLHHFKIINKDNCSHFRYLFFSIGNQLANWLIENKIIEHIFGPNLHVEVRLSEFIQSELRQSRLGIFIHVYVNYLVIM